MVWWSNPMLLTQSQRHLRDKNKKCKLRNSERNPIHENYDVQTQPMREESFETGHTALCGVMLIWLALHLLWKSSVTRQLGIWHLAVFCVYVGGSLAMASSMAMAAKVPARPWPLMKMVLYFCGSRPTRPNRLPCSTAPNAAEKRHFTTALHNTETLLLSGFHSHTDLQLMNQIVAMVTEKKRSSSMGTLTSTAVRMKSSRIKTRLPAIRIASDILKHNQLTHTLVI